MSFATYMKGLRTDKSESQVNMAKILEISVTAIKLIENGDTKFPSGKVLKKLCEYTDSSPIDVMTNIMFGDENDPEKDDTYLIHRFLAYMHLEGWNIESYPYIVPLMGTATRTFDAKITKKRANKNVQVICSYDRFLVRLSMDEVLEYKNTIGYISDAVALILAIMEPFKGLIILFDPNDEKQKEMFDLFDENIYCHVDFNIDMVLFDPVNGEILNTKRVTKKSNTNTNL